MLLEKCVSVVARASGSDDAQLRAHVGAEALFPFNPCHYLFLLLVVGVTIPLYIYNDTCCGDYPLCQKV